MRALGQQLGSKVTRGMNKANNAIATNLSNARSKLDRVGNDFAKNTIEQALANGPKQSVGSRIKGMADNQARNVVNGAQKKWAEGFAEGVKPQPRKPKVQTASPSASVEGPTATPSPTVPPNNNGITDAASRFRGGQDIKMTARGEAPLSTFFRDRESRDAMIASGKGSSYQFAKGSTSWKRVGATAAAGYVGIDAVDRMSSGGSLTRNETGRSDLVGIPIL